MDNALIKRYSLTEIVLLAVFVLGLVFAQIIVKVRHRIIFSEPIALTGSGLSVCMPTSPGWEYEKAWHYEADNSMALVAQHQAGQSREASIQWRYYLCSPAGSAKDILEQRAKQTDSTIGPIETISEPVPMEYTVVYPAGGSSPPFYMGVARLDFGRHLELQVYPHEVDIFYADNLFRALADGIQYTLPEQLQNGKKLATLFWDTLGSDLSWLGKHTDETFLIKSMNNQPIGYSCLRYSTLHADQQTQLQISLRQYEHNMLLLESTFRLNGGEKRFMWKTSYQRAGMGNARLYSVVNEPDGRVTISTNFDKEKQFTSDSSLLPELFLPACATMLLDGEQQSDLIIDVLAPDGAVVPTVMKRIEITQALAHSDQIAFVVKVEFLNHPKSFEELYFDANRKFIGRFEQQPQQQRLWDLTTPDELRRIFKENFQISDDKVAQIRTPQRKPCENRRVQCSESFAWLAP